MNLHSMPIGRLATTLAQSLIYHLQRWLTLMSGPQPHSSLRDTLLTVASQAGLYHDVRGLLFHDGRLVLPDALGIRQMVFDALHASPFAGHKGLHATSKLLKRDFYWPCMDADIKEWLQVCPSCQRNKVSNKLPAGLLEPLPIPTRRWSDVSMDFITHLPLTRQGHTAIFVVVDRLSKLVHFIPTVDSASAEDVARLFIDNIFALHGMPERIVSDRDTRFTGTFWKSLCDLWKVDRQLVQHTILRLMARLKGSTAHWKTC